MGLQMTEKETLYHRKQMYENMKVHGIPAVIESIGDTYDNTYDFYNDISDDKKSFDDSVHTHITYESVPSIRTLRSLGWYIETEDFPVIAYIPVMYYTEVPEPSQNDDGIIRMVMTVIEKGIPIEKEGYYAVSSFHPKVDDRVTLISNPIDSNSSTRKFLIKDFKGNGFPNTIYYTCKLVPYRVDSNE